MMAVVAARQPDDILSVNGTGTIFKKCDRGNHNPDSNKNRAGGTCQHSCDDPEKCGQALYDPNITR
jgi:hypothetical protein